MAVGFADPHVFTGTGSISWAMCSASMLLLSDSSSVLVFPFRVFTVPFVVMPAVKDELDVTGFNGSINRMKSN